LGQSSARAADACELDWVRRRPRTATCDREPGGSVVRAVRIGPRRHRPRDLACLAIHEKDGGVSARTAAALCGIAGPACLVASFAAPAFPGWPYAGASPDRVVLYATTHASLFYAGAWLQVTGTLLSLVFYLALLREAGELGKFWGSVLIVVGA